MVDFRRPEIDVDDLLVAVPVKEFGRIFDEVIADGNDQVRLVHRDIDVVLALEAHGEQAMLVMHRDRALAHDKLEFLWNTEVLEFLGDPKDGLQGLRIANNKSGEEGSLSVHGCFIAIGHDPNTEILTESPISLDEQGYVAPDGRHFPFTPIEGVFVAGDVHDHHYRQAVTAAGHGCAAAIDAERYLAG